MDVHYLMQFQPSKSYLTSFLCLTETSDVLPMCIPTCICFLFAFLYIVFDFNHTLVTYLIYSYDNSLYFFVFTSILPLMHNCHSANGAHLKLRARCLSLEFFPQCCLNKGWTSEYPVIFIFIICGEKCFVPHQHIPHAFALSLPLSSGLLYGGSRYRWSTAETV